MEEYFEKLSKSLTKKTARVENGRGCIEWVGCLDRYGYGRKRVTLPDKSVTMESAHRVAYMVHHKLLPHEVPHSDCPADLI
jgi:hypothetical protein